MADELAQPFTLIIDDPLSNSYIAGDPDDENLVIRQYTRTQEQDEELGLLDMKVD